MQCSLLQEQQQVFITKVFASSSYCSVIYCTIFIYLLVSLPNNSNNKVIFNSECVKWTKSGLIIVELDIEEEMKGNGSHI